MKRIFMLFLACSWATSALAARAEAAAPQAATDEAEIRTVIAAQVAAWNRGDIAAFMQAYEDSPDTTFIGLTVRKGYQPILERYRKAYTTPEQMGMLTFSDLEIRPLPGSCGKAEFALVTGRFHLDRKARGDTKKDDGIFSLVWRKGASGWRILLDHTS
jgi:uncharacterized protein (TIGR02246 family)